MERIKKRVETMNERFFLECHKLQNRYKLFLDKINHLNNSVELAMGGSQEAVDYLEKLVTSTVKPIRGRKKKCLVEDSKPCATTSTNSLKPQPLQDITGELNRNLEPVQKTSSALKLVSHEIEQTPAVKLRKENDSLSMPPPVALPKRKYTKRSKKENESVTSNRLRRTKNRETSITSGKESDVIIQRSSKERMDLDSEDECIPPPSKTASKVKKHKKESAHNIIKTISKEPAQTSVASTTSRTFAKKTIGINSLILQKDMNSPVKQKVRAFEKLAGNTPQKKIKALDTKITEGSSIHTPLKSKSRVAMNNCGKGNKGLTPIIPKTMNVLDTREARELFQKKLREAEQGTVQELGAAKSIQEFELQFQQEVLVLVPQLPLKEEAEKKQEKKVKTSKGFELSLGTVCEQPIFKMYKAPLLPTYDCYDSDDNEVLENVPRIPKPHWTTRECIAAATRTSSTINNYLRNCLFSSGIQTCDLQEVFVDVEPRNLRRHSSAIWHEKPRYSTMFELTVR